MGTFPSLQRRGGCGINQKSRSTEEPQTGWSLRRHVSQTHSKASLVSDHPVRAFFRNGSILLMVHSPPLQGGECTYPKSVSNTLVRSVMLAECMASRAAKRNPSSRERFFEFAVHSQHRDKSAYASMAYTSLLCEIYTTLARLVKSGYENSRARSPQAAPTRLTIWNRTHGVP